MSFASVEYAVLLTLVFGLYWALGRLTNARLWLLLVASYVFYGWWRPSYLLLIAGSSLFDYLMGQRIHRAQRPESRQKWLRFSVVANLGVLALFKYYSFITQALTSALARLGWALRFPRLGWTLPAGISFYTFQSMSYTIDIYRGELAPAPHALAFLVFVAFFPQLVAGPIVRASYFLPQLSVSPALDETTGSRGVWLIALGLIKKLAIADLLAINLVDRVFDTPQLYSSAELLLGVYGYALQIYCDFSAYSDIAVGSGLLLGLALPDNFHRPYAARNLRDFWRRWHISLSTWLRDYLYLPLGGSHGTTWQTYRNLLLTMVLGGLWHGAAWTFVCWGALHGVGLAATRAWQRWRKQVAPAAVKDSKRHPVAEVVAIMGTFQLVCVGWVVFRAPSLQVAGSLLKAILAGSWGTANISPLVWFALAAGVATHAIPLAVSRWLERLACAAPAWLQAMLFAVLVLALRYVGTSQVVPFIYFQF